MARALSIIAGSSTPLKQMEARMNADPWLWVALVAFLIFCCVPMLFMRHGDRGGKSKSQDDQEKM